MVNEVIQCVQKLMASLKITSKSEIEVLLAGGSVYLPCFRAQLQAAVGKNRSISCDLNALEVVASGAAIKAAFFEDIQCRQEIFMNLIDPASTLLPAHIKQDLSPYDVNDLVGDELQAGRVLAILDRFNTYISKDSSKSRELMDEHIVDLAKSTHQERQFENFNALMLAVDQELQQSVSKSKVKVKSGKQKKQTNPITTSMVTNEMMDEYTVDLAKESYQKHLNSNISLDENDDSLPVPARRKKTQRRGRRIVTAQVIGEGNVDVSAQQKLQEEMASAFLLASHEEIEATWKSADPSASPYTPQDFSNLFAPSAPPPILVAAPALRSKSQIKAAFSVEQSAQVRSNQNESQLASPREKPQLNNTSEELPLRSKSGPEDDYQANNNHQSDSNDRQADKIDRLPALILPQLNQQLDQSTVKVVRTSLPFYSSDIATGANLSTADSGIFVANELGGVIKSRANVSSSKSPSKLNLSDGDTDFKADAAEHDAEENFYQRAFIPAENDEENDFVEWKGVSGSSPQSNSSKKSVATSPRVPPSLMRSSSLLNAAASSPLARKRRAAILAEQRAHLPEMALANATERQKLLLELQEGSVSELQDLSQEPNVEQALRTVLLVLGFASSDLSSWGGIMGTVKRVGHLGLQRRIKSFQGASLTDSPRTVVFCLDAMSELCPHLQRDNVLSGLDGRPRRPFENRLLEKLFNWAAVSLQEARVRISLVKPTI